MKATTVAIAGAGILVVVGIGVVTLGLGFGKPDVDVTLKMDKGVCQPSDPDRLGGWKGRKVRWNVINIDCASQYISFRNFRHSIGNGDYDPAEDVVAPNPVQGGPVATGTTVTVDAKIAKGEFFKLFKYHIWVGDTSASQVRRIDPDIDIWP
jgi:hypothetical protein